jgi:hypothetical protein
VAVRPLLLWCAWLALSAFWSPDPGLTLYYAGWGLPLAFLTGYVWARNCSPWELSTFFWLQAVMLLPIVAVSLWTTGQLYESDRGSVRSMLAAQLVMALPFVVWRARNRPSLGRYGLVALSVLLLAGGGSRIAPVVGLLMLIVSIAFVQRERRQRLRGALLAFGGVLTLALIAMSLPVVRSGASDAIARFVERDEYVRTDEGDEVPADVVRLISNAVALQSFKAHPIHGGGYFSTLSITTGEHLAVGAHGLPALLFGETGLVGVAIFLWLLVRFFRGAALAGKRAATAAEQGFWQTAQLAMIGMLLFGLFHQIAQMSQFFILLSWGYAAKYPRSPLVHAPS